MISQALVTPYLSDNSRFLFPPIFCKQYPLPRKRFLSRGLPPAPGVVIVAMYFGQRTERNRITVKISAEAIPDRSS